MPKPSSQSRRTRQWIIVVNLLAAIGIILTAMQSRQSTGRAEAASTGTPTQSAPTSSAE